MNLYNMYRAFKAGKKIFIIYRKWDIRLTWCESKEHLHKRFTNPVNGDTWRVIG